MSDSLRPHGLQHTRPPCSSPTPGVHPNSCPLSQWCHPTIESSVIPFYSCPQPLPASGSFQKSQFFASGGQRIGVSASTLVLPKSIQDWSPLGRTGWISLQSKGLWRGFSNTYTSVKWQMATSHRSPYCPQILKLVHVKPPNAQKLNLYSFVEMPVSPSQREHLREGPLLFVPIAIPRPCSLAPQHFFSYFS